MNYEQERQKKIDEAIKKKEIRQTKTEKNIQFCWSVNNASAFVPEKLKGTKEGFELIKKYQPKFIGLYRDWAIENIVFEEKKLTRKGFAITSKNAPESEAMQNKADELREEEPEPSIDEKPIPIINE